MKRLTLPLVALLGAFVLAACSVTVELPGPPDNAIPVSASESRSALDFDRTYSPGETKVFRVTVSPTVQGDDLVYVELNRDLRLEVRPGGSGYSNVSFSAVSKHHFGAGLSGVSAAGADLGAMAINVPLDCTGSCVLLDSVANEFYVRVVNTSSNTVSGVDLFVYGAGYQDVYETSNDVVGGAVLLSGDDSGAIETVGDVDYWRVNVDGTVAFDVKSGGIALDAHIVDAAGNLLEGPFVGGQTLTVWAGDRIRVKAQNPNVAAVASSSLYYIELLSP